MFSCQVAIFNTELSIQNFKAAMEVPAALGLDPSIANSGKPKQLIALDFILDLEFGGHHGYQKKKKRTFSLVICYASFLV